MPPPLQPSCTLLAPQLWVQELALSGGPKPESRPALESGLRHLRIESLCWDSGQLRPEEPPQTTTLTEALASPDPWALTLSGVSAPHCSEEGAQRQHCA